MPRRWRQQVRMPAEEKPAAEGKPTKEEKPVEEKPRPAAAAAAAAAADAIIAAVTDEIMMMDLKGNIVRVNEAWEKTSGFKTEEVVGKPVFELSLPPEFTDKIPEIMQELVEKGHMGPTETVITGRDGTRRPVIFSASLIRDYEGNPMNIVAISKDITELKHLQEKERDAAAAAAAARARATTEVIESIPDALLVLDLNGVIVNVNPAMTKIFGYTPEERIGKSFDELGESIKAEEIERFMKLMGEFIKTGHVEPIEAVLRAKDGREIPTSVTASLIKDAEGNPKNIVAVLRDITELKQAEEERAKADKRRIRELEKFSKVAVGRELQMVELKKRIKELEAKLGEK